MNDCRCELTVPNTRVPPRPRSTCFAVSPRRGEQRPLGRPSGRDITNQFDHKQQIAAINKMFNNKNGMADLNKLTTNMNLIRLRENLESPRRFARTARNNSTSRKPQSNICTRRPPTHRPPMLICINHSCISNFHSNSIYSDVIQITDTLK